jgi:uroporphyrinogen-III synthase
MVPGSAPASAIGGSLVISLRPVGAHAGTRRAAAAHGARVLALSPWKLVARDGSAARPALTAALDAPLAIFTSPAAVRAAAAIAPLAARQGQQRLAVGATTAAALRRAGVAEPLYPLRMDSEGLLAMPVLGEVRGLDIGLVTAPEGRSLLTASLQQRGARVLRADVYDRVAVPPSPRALAALRTLPASTPLLLALSSGLALESLIDALPPDVLARLRRARVLAASARLAELAREHGFNDVVQAADARPASLLAVAAGPGATGEPG